MDWPAILYIVALIAIISVVPVTLVRRWLKQHSHQDSNAFSNVAAPPARQLKTEVAEVTWLAHEVKATHTVTRASIQHTARLPYVVQFEEGKVHCYDKKGYQDWTSQGGDPRCVPLPAQQLCELDLLKRLQSVPGLSQMKGIIAIEPGRVVALEEGEHFDPAYAQQLIAIMVKLAEEAEKPAFTLPTVKKSPALP